MSAAITAADVEAFILARASELSGQIPGENVFISIGANRWPFMPPESDRKWVNWHVTLGADESVMCPDLDVAIQRAVEAHKPSGKVQAKLDQIAKLQSEIRELTAKEAK